MKAQPRSHMEKACRGKGLQGELCWPSRGVFDVFEDLYGTPTLVGKPQR